MALLNAGYWPTTYWPDRYWEPNYWPAYGAVTPSEGGGVRRRRAPPHVRRTRLSPTVLELLKEYLEAKLHEPETL